MFAEIVHAIILALLPWLEAKAKTPTVLRDAPDPPALKRYVQRMRRGKGVGVPLRKRSAGGAEP